MKRILISMVAVAGLCFLPQESQGGPVRRVLNNMHERRVERQEMRVMRHQPVPVTTKVTATSSIQIQSGCANGNCPLKK